MEPADIPESTGECSSNESGWTMYIATPCDEHDHHDEGDDSSENYQFKENTDDNNGGDSDDSLTSDASSGKAGNKKSSAATKQQQQQKEEAKECGKNVVVVKVAREDAVRDKSFRGRHGRSFLQKK